MQEITELAAFFFLSPLLFDITPDINEMNSDRFILRVGPPYRSSLLRSRDDDSCLEDQMALLDTQVDLEKLYNKYKSCKVLHYK